MSKVAKVIRRVAVIATVLLTTVGHTAQVSQTTEPKDDDILVVVNKTAPIDNTTIQELKNIFLKNKSFWKDGKKVIPIHARQGTPLRSSFCQLLLNMTPMEEQEYWKETKIKVGTTEPAAISNTQKAVFKLRAAVSYVYRSNYKDGVNKIILTLPAK